MEDVLSVTIVDCGSGATRGTFFQCRLEDATVGTSPEIKVDATHLDWRGAPLARSLQDEQKCCDFLNMLEAGVPSGSVFLGATAGVRSALATGLISQSQLDAFEVRLKRKLGNHANFHTLTDLEEGAAEWEAVQYSVRQRHIVDPSFPSVCSGMFSCGGMSCQLAVQGGTGTGHHQVFSFENNILKPGSLTDRARREELTLEDVTNGLKEYKDSLAVSMSHLPTRLNGTFVIIEMAASYIAGKKSSSLGLGYDKPISRLEILAALSRQTRFLQKLVASQATIDRRPVVDLVHMFLFRATMEDLFEDSSTFYAIRDSSWPLGRALISAKSKLCF